MKHERIQQVAERLNLTMTTTQIEQIIRYLSELQKWNKVYNLTALKTEEQMLTHHIFDSMAIVPLLQPKIHHGDLLLDVGSGGGLPAVVLAIMLPTLRVVAVDAVDKKVSFIRQVSGILKLSNLTAEHTRIENRIGDKADFIVSRAFASVYDFVCWSCNQLKDNGLFLAMKGQYPQEEIVELEQKTNWTVVQHDTVLVPELDADRCLLWLQKRESE